MEDTQTNDVVMEEDSSLGNLSKLWGVFPVFANTLDLNTFVRLSMASRTIRDRCLEDSMIRISLEEIEITVKAADNGSLKFSLVSFDVADDHTEGYLKMLRKLKCNVSLKRVRVRMAMNTATCLEIRGFLEELGVKNVDSLILAGQCTDWEQTSSFIKHFNVQSVDVKKRLPDDVLQSVLQMNLRSFVYRARTQGEILLQADSSIPKITLLKMSSTADVFAQILWKIQTGALKTLILNDILVPWDRFPSISSNHANDLPTERPLLIIKDCIYPPRRWFLHCWDGAVTECVGIGFHEVEISKCDPAEFPLVLQTKEKVHKALAEKEGIKCTKAQFTSFFDGYTVVEASHVGPLPEDRPLLFKSEAFDYLLYILLNEDCSMDSYSWEKEVAKYRRFDLATVFPGEFNKHFPLRKFLVDRHIQKRTEEICFECKEMEEFHRLFEDYSPLPHDVNGELPEHRPLVFKKTISEGPQKGSYRFVHYEHGITIQYYFDGYFVASSLCPKWNLPSFLLSNELFMEIIQKAPRVKLTYSMESAAYHDAFKAMRNIPFRFSHDLPIERPLVFTKSLDNANSFEQCWVLLKSGKVRKCTWKDGQATLSMSDPREFPPIVTKTLIQNFFKHGEINAKLGLFVDRDILNDQLKEFEILEYDDSPSLYGQRPLIFQKTTIRHTCLKRNDCQCTAEVLHLWYLSVEDAVTHITWGEKEDRCLRFDKDSKLKDAPPVLTSKLLDYLLKKTRTVDCWSCLWRGRFEDYEEYFKSHRTVDFCHEGRLPRTRPLVFTKKHNKNDFWYLREDGVIVECMWFEKEAQIAVSEYSEKPVCLGGVPEERIFC